MKQSKVLLVASLLVLGAGSAFTTSHSNLSLSRWHKTGANNTGSCTSFTTLCTTGTKPNFTQNAGSGTDCLAGNIVYTASNCQNQLKKNPND